MRTKGTAGLLACLLVWAALGNAVPASAAATAADTGSGTNATTHVARVSLIEGGNIVVTHGDGQSAVAVVNTPLMPGDAFATTDQNTRGEVQLDGFTDVRLGGSVKARIVDNDAHARRIEMTRGLLELAVLRGGDLASEVVTPSFTLRTHYAGDYRVFVESDGSASITPRSGQADVVTPHKAVTIMAGATLVVHGSADEASAESHSAIARDSFDEFNAQRDLALLQALGNDTHVPASIAGYDDLSAYGRWSGLKSYGQVWIPNDQRADWAPYRNGQWSYVGNDGWTWIGSEPWAWVPYHYGRWLYSAGYGWCWYPPPFGFDPIWAPALVGFFGYGDGGLGFSNFGWVPLAPFEAYVPWYPPPPPHHRGPPVRMHPLVGEFRNARFGGASAVGAGSKIVPLVPATAIRASVTSVSPVMKPAVPAIAVTAPVVHPVTPILPTVTPIFHESAPSRSVHSGSPHPPA